MGFFVPVCCYEHTEHVPESGKCKKKATKQFPKLQLLI